MLNIDLRGVFLLRKVNTNKHFTYSSTVEVFLNELFNGLALDEIKASSYEEESRQIEPLEKEIQQACSEKKENTREINAFFAKMLENPADYIEEFKIIMPNYELKGYKIRNFIDNDKFKNILKQAVLDPTFKRDSEIYFGYNKHKIDEIKEKVEQNRELAKNIREKIQTKKEIIQEEQSTRNMIQAAYPEVKKQEKEEIKNQKEAEKKNRERYLRERDRKNYQIQKQRLNWEKRKLERQRMIEERQMDQTYEKKLKYNPESDPDALDNWNYQKKMYEARYGKKYREKPKPAPITYPKKTGDGYTEM